MNTNNTMNELVKLTAADGNYKYGQKYIATVKAVHKEGVNVEMPGNKGSGTITPRCWGKGEAREAALAALSVGDNLEVVVKAYHAPTMSLALVLAGCEHLLTAPSASERNKIRQTHKAAKATAYKASNVQRPVIKQQNIVKKPAYRLVPAGATMLIDTANVIGVLGPQKAAYKLSVIENTLSERGYKALFFIEGKTLAWACCNQDSQEDADALEAFCNKANVSKVGGEADLPMLQAACAIPNSVCVTRDRFQDYRESYSEIVGTERHCMCSSVKVEGKTLFSIFGLREAIVIEDEVAKVRVLENTFTEVAQIEPEVVESRIEGDLETPEVVCEAPVAVEAPRKGLLGVGDACREKGDLAKAVECYSRVAKKDPTAYYDLAEIYTEGEDDYCNARVASKYTRLGQKSEKKLRQCEMRRARLRAEGRRTGHHVRGLMRAA